MSNPRLPPETMDHVVDHLHDTEDALKNCCLVSKSWTPRARKHLFADITFRSADDLKSWKETFPNPLASPAYHTYILSVHCVRAVTTADAGPGGWLTGFSSVVYLETWDHEVTPGESMISLVPFHGFSPVLKYLRLTSAFLPPSRVFNFILSFPHLEGLTVTTYQRALTDDNDGSDGSSTIAQPWNPPAFTGYLDLLIMGGMEPIARRLLSLSGGFNFWKLNLTCFHEEDFSLAMALVERCSHTLKSFSITCDLFVESMSVSIDLSKATRLMDVTFLSKSQSVDWIAAALQTITPKHRDLRRISIHVLFDPALTTIGANIAEIVGEQILGQWLDLDRLLVQLWESRSIRPTVITMTLGGEQRDTRNCIGCLLPESTTRGIIDLAG